MTVGELLTSLALIAGDTPIKVRQLFEHDIVAIEDVARSGPDGDLLIGQVSSRIVLCI